MNRIRSTFILSIVTVTVLIATGCGKDPELEKETPRRNVSVEQIQIGNYAEQFTVSGRVEHSQEALLSFRSGGLVDQMLVDDGDRITAGQLLAILDTTEIGAGLADASQQRTKAERDVARLQHLYDQEAISLQALQDAQTGLERALAGERRAKFIVDNSLIHAPFAGFVAMRLANDGEMIGEGVPVLRVVENGATGVVRVGVPSRLIPWLHVGDSAEVSVETIDQLVVASIARIGAVAEQMTGNFIIELELPSGDYLREGLVAKVTLSGPAQPGIALPGGALAEGDDDRGMFYVVDNGVAVRRQLTIQRISGDLIYVEPDLPEGTLVIVAGSGFLTDGEAVDVVDVPEMVR